MGPLTAYEEEEGMKEESFATDAPHDAQTVGTGNEWEVAPSARYVLISWAQQQAWPLPRREDVGLLELESVMVIEEEGQVGSRPVPETLGWVQSGR